MHIITEIVTMETIGDITKEKFISIVNDLEQNFHSKQLGFIDTELLFDEQKNLWIIIQHWESAEQAKMASKRMFSDSAAEAFVKSVSPKSVKMTVATQIQIWRKIHESI